MCRQIVYSPPVHRPSVFIIGLTCVALLSMQLAGVHMHVNVEGGHGGIYGTHVHDAGPGGGDHSADVDVSLFELGTAWSKLVPLLPGYTIVLLTVVWILHTLWPPPLTALALRRRSRWLPPLRAPPITTN